MSTGGTGKGACFTGGVTFMGACFTGGKDLTGGITASGSAGSVLPPAVNLLKSTGAGFDATGSGVSKSMMVFPDISLFLPTGI